MRVAITNPIKAVEVLFPNYPREYNYWVWNVNEWRYGATLIDFEGVVEKISRGQIIGLSKFFYPLLGVGLDVYTIELDFKDCNYDYIDPQESQLMRTIRVPLTRHPKTKNPGWFLDIYTNKPRITNNIEINKLTRAEIFNLILETKETTTIKELIRASKEKKKTKPPTHKTTSLPNWVIILIEYLKQTGELCHEARRAIVQWVLWTEVTNKGRSLDEVINELNELFKKYASDYKEKITLYQIRYAWEKWVSQGKLPISCRHVTQTCGTHDAPPLNC